MAKNDQMCKYLLPFTKLLCVFIELALMFIVCVNEQFKVYIYIYIYILVFKVINRAEFKLI
jgi:hypothetical protein